jgi:osmotically-inducible protein OsmY
MDDKELRNLILEELDWDPSFESTDIGVQVADGVVTLTGHVSSYSEKVAVERACSRVKGVRAVAQEVEIRLPQHKKTADDEIAKRIVDVWAWNVDVPQDRIRAKVQGGFVTLTGDVDWRFQRDAAEDSVRRLGGVMGVSNQIALKARVAAGDVRRRIEDALRRNAEAEASNIRVVVADGKVTLEGRVKALHERSVIESAAWAAPGVREVDDRVQVTG